MIKQGTERTQMGTLAVRVNDSNVMSNSGTAKIVVDQSSKTLYFSRQPIPYFSDSRGTNVSYLKHIGVYIYKKEFLLRFPRLKKGPLEIAENLEQLRALENGYQVQVVLVDKDTIHVDTVDDLIRAEKCVRGWKNR
jgi:3-deoxy-manno-octulosonate cytidylyltransferase (CMP-KDO synthetase)